MLPGTKYTPESVLRIVWRHSWLIAIPLVVGSASAYLWARELPNLYRAETVMMLMPQRISDGYVKAAVNVPVADRLTTLKEQVLSRPHLEQIIQDVNLYSEVRRNGSMEALVARMRKDTTIKPEGPGSFRLSYVNQTPVVAQEVTERLAALFNAENSKYRENVAEVTNEFLDSQMADAKARLLEQEKKLQEYRERYGTELPTQTTANLQAMQGVESRLSALADGVDRDRASRLVVERQLAELQSADPELSGTSAGSSAGGPQSAAQQLEAARADLAQLEMRNKPDHPDVRMQQRKVRDLQAKAEAEATTTTTADPTSAPTLTPTEANRQRRLQELTTQMADIDHQLARKDEQGRQLRATIAAYEARLNALPTRESELVELTRDYSTLLNSYNSLAAKREESTLSANLERKDVGEQFRVLDPPRVPEAPFSPDRLTIQLIGGASGLAIGLALVGFLEYRDATFKNEDEIFRVLKLPVLAVVPVMVTSVDLELRKKRTIRLVAAISAVAIVCIGIVARWWR